MSRMLVSPDSLDLHFRLLEDAFFSRQAKRRDVACPIVSQ
jgi:hypothetical protein